MTDPKTLRIVLNVLDELRMLMQVTSEKNPLVVIDQFVKEVPTRLDEQGYLIRPIGDVTG